MNVNLAKKVKIAALAGLAFMLTFLPPIPLFPPAPFLTYNPSDVPALVGAFALGPGAGLAIIIVKSLLMLAWHFDPIHLVGIPMDIISGSALIGTASWFYWRNKTVRTALGGLALGTLAMTAIMIPANYLVFGLIAKIMHVAPTYSATGYVLTMCAPFNFLKGVVSSILSFLIYKRVSEMLK